MIINCTPHAIEIYAADAPDVIEFVRGAVTFPRPLLTIAPEAVVARISEREIISAPSRIWHGAEVLGRNALASICEVEYGHISGLPAVRPAVWVVVSLALALAVPARGDLLVPWRQVRNERGTVIGCRGLARPC
jgi:hypothetical protein